MYAQGQGVPTSYKGAAVAFRKALDQGQAKAQYNLGSIYGKGQEVPKHSANTLPRNRKAAALGHQGALCCLAELEAVEPPARMEPVECTNCGALDSPGGAVLKPCAG